MMTSECCNDIVLEGKVLAAPAPSHENHGVHFFRFFLEVPRLSGQADTLPVLIPESMVQQVCQGETVRVRGQLRSFNNRSGVGSRLVLTVYGQEVLPPCGEAANHIALIGSLCKAPIYRRTPLGRTICDLMLAVPRRYGRTDYLPVIAWGQLAQQVRSLSTGARICLEGRLQSRIYQKVTESGTEERVAYEVSIMRLESQHEDL